ncbi:MAG: hypothetical protein ACFFBP_21690 [Promethearchaeota archaeon]
MTHRVLKAKRNKFKLRFHLKHVLSLFLIFIFIISIFLVNCPLNQNLVESNRPIIKDDPKSPLIAGVDPEILIPPYLKNITDICNFFKNNYESSYSDILYYRRGDTNGNIIDDTVYSIDNILFYKTIEKQLETLSGSETYINYTQLKSTNLYYYYNSSVYGFVNSINGTTGDIIDANRYLIDNLMPIFLLLDNYASSSYQEVLDIYNLIRRPEFWDSTNIGFLNSNSSYTDHKYAKDNLYAILAYMLIARSPQFDSTTRNVALYIANQTMIKLLENIWDYSNPGFKVETYFDWSPILSPATPALEARKKHLEINALGIMALLDFFVQTNESIYLENATLLYNKMNGSLWVPSLELYYYSTEDEDWDTTISNDDNKRVILEDNAIMMKACLKLFEITGNITYYERAYQLFESIERRFYDTANKAYKYIIFPPSKVNPYKNITSNLFLIDAYMEAAEIYNSPRLIASYNVTEAIPDYIFNQDLLNITTSFIYNSFMSTTYISDINITYVFNYPNGTMFDEVAGYINKGNTSHELIYNITDSLPYGDGYTILIWVNSSYFCYNETILTFNVISGLVDKLIEGLGITLYQGPTLNISIPINNTRNGNVTLDVSMESDNIINQYLNGVNFTSYLYANDTIVSFNLTTITNAELGPDNIIFKFTKGNVLYLLINASIIIGDSFDHTAIIHDSEVVDEDLVEIKFNLINFLPNDPQSVNISFSSIKGNILNDSVDLREQINLNRSESRQLIYNLNVSGTGSIIIVMSLSKGSITYYNETMSITIVPALEIIRTTYPRTVTQWDYSNLIIKIENNRKQVEDYTLTIVEQNPLFGVPNSITIEGQLAPGINRIQAQIFSTLNPYDFGVKNYLFELRDSNGELIESDFFEVSIELSTSALFFCYIIPITIPFIIILIYLSKNLKNKQLRRR